MTELQSPTDPGQALKKSLARLVAAHPDNATVRTFTSQPPDALNVARAVWFVGGDFRADINDQRAGRKKYLIEGTIGFQCFSWRAGGTDDDLDPVTDDVVRILATLHSVLADDPYGGIPDLIQWAKLASGRLDQGWRDDGTVAIVIGTISYQSKPL